MKHPILPVAKTIADLMAYESKHGAGTVAEGIWYEVAFSEYLNDRFAELGTVKVFLFDWGSKEDRLQAKDALICFSTPQGKFCVAVDYTTDDRSKKNFVFRIEKRWFSGAGPTMKVEPDRTIRTHHGKMSVYDVIDDVFANWAEIAIRTIPREPWPDAP